MVNFLVFRRIYLFKHFLYQIFLIDKIQSTTKAVFLILTLHLNISSSRFSFKNHIHILLSNYLILSCIPHRIQGSQLSDFIRFLTNNLLRVLLCLFHDVYLNETPISPSIKLILTQILFGIISEPLALSWLHSVQRLRLFAGLRVFLLLISIWPPCYLFLQRLEQSDKFSVPATNSTARTYKFSCSDFQVYWVLLKFKDCEEAN